MALMSGRRFAVARLDRRTVLGVALAAGAALAVLLVTRPSPTVPVLVAADDLPAGVPLARLPVTVRHTTDADGLVVGEEVGELSDWTLRVPLAAGEPLLPSLLTPPALQDAPDLLSVELETAHAALGRIAAGDRVDVYATVTLPGQMPVTEKIADGVFVVDVEVTEAVGVRRIAVLLAVDEDLATRLTGALRRGELDLVRRGTPP